jgi:hypothetical protein
MKSINLDHLIVFHIMIKVLTVVKQSDKNLKLLLIYYQIKNYFNNKDLKQKLSDKK